MSGWNEIPAPLMPLMPAADCERVHNALDKVQSGMGLAKIRMGALLCIVSDNQTWRGRTSGNTFRQYLIEKDIEPKAALQYMKVGRVLIHQLGLKQEELVPIANASMRVLTKMVEVLTLENKTEIFSLVSTLPRVEALEALAPFSPAYVAPENAPLKTPPRVRKLLDAVDDLTFEEKADLMRRLGRQPTSTLDEQPRMRLRRPSA